LSFHLSFHLRERFEGSKFSVQRGHSVSTLVRFFFCCGREQVSNRFLIVIESRTERDAWVNAIRTAKAARLSSFQVTHPGTTLTSSTSGAHVRRALQALPHDPAAPSESPSLDSGTSKDPRPVRRGKVDHFVPAIWVPDQKAETCMRCNSRFGWMKRRHHCRLCGRVVCGSCSERVRLQFQLMVLVRLADVRPDLLYCRGG
jgi:hypothetical protein